MGCPLSPYKGTTVWPFIGSRIGISNHHVSFQTSAVLENSGHAVALCLLSKEQLFSHPLLAALQSSLQFQTRAVLENSGHAVVVRLLTREQLFSHALVAVL